MPILKRILVATDLSATGHRAVMRAGQLARQWETGLFLVHARPDWNLLMALHRKWMIPVDRIRECTEAAVQLQRATNQLATKLDCYKRNEPWEHMTVAKVSVPNKHSQKDGRLVGSRPKY